MEHRSLDDICKSISRLVDKKSAVALRLQNEALSHTVCLCGADRLGSFEGESFLESRIYVERTQKGLRFAPCPACYVKNLCAFCHGSQYRMVDIDGVDKNGQVEKKTELVPCSCMNLERTIQLLNNAKIPDKFIHATFENFEFDAIQDQLGGSNTKIQKNIKDTKSFCDNVTDFLSHGFFSSYRKTKGAAEPFHHDSDKKPFALLFGPVGCGKTRMAVAALKYLIMKYGCTGLFVDFQLLLYQFKAEYDKSKSDSDLVAALGLVDVLVIDELGKGRLERQWQREKLDDLIQSRYNTNKVTFLTTNYLPVGFHYDTQDIPAELCVQQQKSSSFRDEGPMENFWSTHLRERIGARMYERIVEVSELIPFLGIVSHRKILGMHAFEKTK